MIIQCIQCATRFRLDNPKPGTKVRCSTCQTTFEVEPPELPPLPASVGGAPSANGPSAPDGLDLDIDFDDSAPKPAPTLASGPARVEEDIGFADADLLGDDDLLDEPDDAPAQGPAPETLAGDETVVTGALEPQAAVTAELEISPEAETRVDYKPLGRAAAEAEPAPEPAPVPEPRPTGKHKPRPTPLPGDFELSRAVTKVSKVPNLARNLEEPKAEPAKPEPVPAEPVAAALQPQAQPQTQAAGADAFGLAAELGEDFFGGAGLSLDGTVHPAPRRPTGRSTGAIALDEVATKKAEPATRSTLQLGGTQQLEAAPPTPAPKATPLNLVVQVLVSLVLVMMIAGGVLVFLGGGKFDARLWRLDPRAWMRVAGGHAPVTFEGARVVSMRSTLYPVTPSSNALVFFGEVENQGRTPYEHLEITAEVRNERGNVLAHAKGPVGVALNPRELVGLASESAVREALRKKASAAPDRLKLVPGARAPFMAIITPPPDNADALVHEVLLGKGGPYAEPPPPHPAPTEPVADAAPELPAKKGMFKKGKKLKKRVGPMFAPE